MGPPPPPHSPSTWPRCPAPALFAGGPVVRLFCPIPSGQISTLLCETSCGAGSDSNGAASVLFELAGPASWRVQVLLCHSGWLAAFEGLWSWSRKIAQAIIFSKQTFPETVSNGWPGKEPESPSLAYLGPPATVDFGSRPQPPQKAPGRRPPGLLCKILASSSASSSAVSPLLAKPPAAERGQQPEPAARSGACPDKGRFLFAELTAAPWVQPLASARRQRGHPVHQPAPWLSPSAPTVALNGPLNGGEQEIAVARRKTEVAESGKTLPLRYPVPPASKISERAPSRSLAQNFGIDPSGCHGVIEGWPGVRRIERQTDPLQCPPGQRVAWLGNGRQINGLRPSACINSRAASRRSRDSPRGERGCVFGRGFAISARLK